HPPAKDPSAMASARLGYTTRDTGFHYRADTARGSRQSGSLGGQVRSRESAPCNARESDLVISRAKQLGSTRYKTNSVASWCGQFLQFQQFFQAALKICTLTRKN